MHATSSRSPSAGTTTATLEVERTGIRFWCPDPDRLRIGVEVHNRGHLPSSPTRMELQVAPFGAFLPWAPLQDLPVPSIEPRGSTIVTTEVPRSRLPVSAGLSGAIPPRIFTAVGAGSPGRPVREIGALWAALRGQLAGLPDDRGETPQWMGNINVLLGDSSVERHTAQDLRILPGRANLAMFLLGSGASYLMRVEGDVLAWEHDLFYSDSGVSLLQGDGTFLFEARRTICRVLFVCRPPADCTRGTADVHVERLPAGDRAVVEFSMDANAAGPGCYVV